MVAYSFKAQFEVPIVSRIKLQTVRGPRKRHARPGEALQLYTAMRTRHCRKLLTPDPVCVDVRMIAIAFSDRQPLLIEIDGIPLGRDEIEVFAIADGFGAPDYRFDGCAAIRMANFWHRNHGSAAFEGVVIGWEHR